MKKNDQIYILLALFSIFIIGATNEKIGVMKKETVIRSPIGSSDGQFGTKIFSDGSWIEPSSIAFDSKKNIYIADPANNRIQIFNEKGNFISKIEMEMIGSEAKKTINDLTVDANDNLYVLSRRHQKIFKYNTDGKLVFTIDLKKQPISWNRYEGWHMNRIQAERISVDTMGNIFIEGFNELIKFNVNGKLEKKLSRENYSQEASYFIDQSGHLYFSKKVGTWEKYDQEGHLMGPVVCEQESLLSFILPDNGSCQFPPKFIDKNGFRYYFELKPKTSELLSIVKVDQKGNFKRYKAPAIDIWQSPNMIKFDADGNLYGYGYDDEKREYWIIRIRLN
jgi:hypothetical protein